MRRSLAVPIAGAAALAMLTACGIPTRQMARQMESAKGKMPYISLGGVVDRIETESYELIGSTQRFAEIWREHFGKGESRLNRVDIPRVDFKRCFVISIFEEGSPSPKGIECLGIVEDEGLVKVRFRKFYQQIIVDGFADLLKPRPPGAVVLWGSSYAFFVIPRNEMPIQLEEGIRGLKPGPYDWVERARLDPKAAR